MRLFSLDIPDAHVGYRNLRQAEFPQEQAINDGLEELWRRYEPYADTDFCSEFARQPDARFWEMYLAIRFLDARKRMRRREELTREQRNTGPDICIRKGRRRIWIEGIATGAGNADNLDQVPNLFAANAPLRSGARRKNSSGIVKRASLANEILASWRSQVANSRFKLPGRACRMR